MLDFLECVGMARNIGQTGSGYALQALQLLHCPFPGYVVGGCT
jgi:hypothetical protein